ADLSTPSVPVFFDYSGLWSRVAGYALPAGYPRPFNPTLRPSGHPPSLSRTSRSIQDLVARPFTPESNGPFSHRTAPASLPRSERKLLENKLVAWKVILDLPRARDFEGGGVDQIIYLSGQLRTDESAPELFRALVSQCAVYPFLFVTDGSRVLLLMARRKEHQDQPREVRTGLMAVLVPKLREIDVIRESLTTIGIIVNHRYDRLLLTV
ncbi:MAG: hypothetical protein WA761_06005, partial [Thermoplasmata archaeon]